MTSLSSISNSDLIDELKSRGFRCIKKELIHHVSFVSETQARDEYYRNRDLAHGLGRVAMRGGLIPIIQETYEEGKLRWRATTSIISTKPPMEFPYPKVAPSE